MIITKKHIFIHIPKTAGQSIVHNYCDRYEIIPHRKHVINKSIHHKEKNNPHISASMVRDIVGDEIYDNAFKFTIVRNPFDRLVSFYYFGIKNMLRNKFKKFGGFVAYACNKQDRKNIGTGWSYARYSQSHFVDDEVDMIIKFEELEDSWDELSTLLGINKHLAKKNKTKHRHYSTYYTPEMVEMVIEAFAEDFERFGYKKEL